MHLEIEPVGSYLRKHVMFITKVINPGDRQVLDSRCRCPAYYSECVAWPLPLISSSAAPGDVCVASTSGDPGPSRSVWPDCGEQMLAGGGCVSNEAS